MRKKRSPTEMLESSKNYDQERNYARAYGREFEDATLESTSHTVRPNSEKIKKMTKGKPYVALHTHPISPGDVNERVDYKLPKKMPNLPSARDLATFMYDKNERTEFIAQQDPKTGEVAGYYALRKTNKYKYPSKGERNNLSDDLESTFVAIRFKGAYDIQSGEYLLARDTKGNPKLNDILPGKRNMTHLNRFFKKYGIQFKAIPVKGYYYDYGLGFKKKKLEHRVLPIVAFVSLIISMIISFSSITGNVISKNEIVFPNFLGIIFFIFGLVCFILGRIYSER